MKDKDKVIKGSKWSWWDEIRYITEEFSYPIVAITILVVEIILAITYVLTIIIAAIMLVTTLLKIF